MCSAVGECPRGGGSQKCLPDAAIDADLQLVRGHAGARLWIPGRPVQLDARGRVCGRIELSYRSHGIEELCFEVELPLAESRRLVTGRHKSKEISLICQGRREAIGTLALE